MSKTTTRPRPGNGSGTAQNNHRKPIGSPSTGYEWMTWARDQEVEPASARHLLLLLASYANEGGECWPGMETLSARMGLSARRVRALADTLVGTGLLRVEHTPRKANGRRGRNRYFLLADRGKLTTGGHLRPGEAGDTEPGEAGDHDRRSPATHELPENGNSHLNRQPARAGAQGQADGEGAHDHSRRSAPAAPTANGSNTRTAIEGRGKQATPGHRRPPVNTAEVIAMIESDAVGAKLLADLRTEGATEAEIVELARQAIPQNVTIVSDGKLAKRILEAAT